MFKTVSANLFGNRRMIQSENYPMIAKTLASLEDVLAEELIALGANDVEIGTRMVSFTGDKALMYKANVHCRTALRILKPIYSFKAENATEVYDALKQLDWEDYLSLDKTFSVDAVVFSHIFTYSKFVAYKVKDAIVDWFNEKYEKRPSVSVTNPDLVFNIHIAHNKCTLSLDSSGESLHKRGYRVAQTEAPLNEVLAAGMILKSGWRGESTFVDPMCGSGTLLIEAAMIALGIPPGIHRQRFGFEKWGDFDKELFSDIYNDDSGSREFRYRIVGSDISPKAIAIAEKNIRNAGLKKYIDLSVQSLQQYSEAPDQKGVLITNPPYGERIKVDELTELYGMIGERLKHLFTGYRAYILSYRKECFDSIGLKHSRRFFLFNGALECEMREYEIFSGKRSEHIVKAEPREREERVAPDHYERNSREGYRRSKSAGDGKSLPQKRSFGDKTKGVKRSYGKDDKFPRQKDEGLGRKKFSLRRSPGKGRERQ
jgi:putative N6-adenine-specific DNA methylase